MEQYLIEQYDVYESKYLTSEDDIIEYFEDIGIDYLDCGQGYFQDEADLIAKVGDKFYSVSIYAEIGSAKQDRGDRLYWVEDITEVSYEEIPKPLPKVKEEIRYFVEVTGEQREGLERYMREQYISFITE